MSRFFKLLAGAALVAGAIAVTPMSAQAQHRGIHPSGHPGGFHHGFRPGGWYRGPGWGWGPGFALGLGLGPAWDWGPYDYGPPYYYVEPTCGWVNSRIRVRGHWRWRQIWRCW